MAYNDQYRRIEWYRLRDLCLELAGHTCTRCGAPASDKVTLQVHHPHYIPGHAVWEYPPDFLEVVCKGCHAEQHGLIPPKTGWTCVYSDWESGGPSGHIRCELCNSSMIWHNILTHPRWSTLIVGWKCASNLECPELKALRTWTQRLDTFRKSNQWQAERVYTPGDRRLITFWHQGKRKHNILEDYTGAFFVAIHKKRYEVPNEDAAKEFCFSMETPRPLIKH